MRRNFALFAVLVLACGAALVALSVVLPPEGTALAECPPSC